MSIFLSESHRMLKADFQRPGRYFGWFYPISNPELLYLTYFTTDFIGTSSGDDTPVVRDQSIPLIHNSYTGVRHTSGTIGAVHTGLPNSFEGLDYVGVRFFGVKHDTYPEYADTALMNWELPFGSSDKWSVTFRAYYPTHDAIQVRYEDESDVDTYCLNPSVYIEGGHSDPISYPKFGTGDFLNDNYPHKVLSTYGQAEEAHPKYWPGSFPRTTLYNGTAYGTYNDPGWPDGGDPPDPYPPSGRMFYSFGNDQITQENGDQWYYTVIVGHGDGTISIYVNGERIINVPFVAIKKLGFYVGAKDFSETARSVLTNGLGHEYMQITEVSVWGNDISINDKMNVPFKTQPIYKKQNGVYVPNEAY